MNAETTRKWLEARRTKKQLEAALREVNEEIDNLEIGILEQFGSDGITQVKIDGATIFQTTVTKCKIEYLPEEDTDDGYERVCDELIKVGLDRLVKRRFFPQSVSSWIDKDGGDEKLLEGILKIDKIHELRVRNL